MTKTTTKSQTTAVKPAKTLRAATAKRLMKVLDLRATAKAAYQEAEAIEGGLFDSLAVGTAYRLPDGRTVVLVDNFAEKNTVWRNHSVRRFEVRVI